MAPRILLDAGLLGLASGDPQNPTSASFRQWVAAKRVGSDVCITPLTRYEARRDLIRAGLKTKLARLDQFCRNLTPLPVTDQAGERATDFWAIVRRRGNNTAPPLALDADAILAGVAATCGRPGEAVIVATTNIRHLGWFPGIDARIWQNF